MLNLYLRGMGDRRRPFWESDRLRPMGANSLISQASTPGAVT